jgi:hypothetical protein
VVQALKIHHAMWKLAFDAAAAHLLSSRLPAVLIAIVQAAESGYQLVAPLRAPLKIDHSSSPTGTILHIRLRAPRQRSRPQRTWHRGLAVRTANTSICCDLDGEPTSLKHTSVNADVFRALRHFSPNTSELAGRSKMNVSSAELSCIAPGGASLMLSASRTAQGSSVLAIYYQACKPPAT